MTVDTTWLRPLVGGVGRELLVEASYYAVRALKQAAVPRTSRKEHLIDTPESEPSPAAIDLATQIIRAIQDREGVRIDDVPQRMLLSYVDQLMGAVREVSDADLRLDRSQARALLERIRGS